MCQKLIVPMMSPQTLNHVGSTRSQIEARRERVVRTRVWTPDSGVINSILQGEIKQQGAKCGAFEYRRARVERIRPMLLDTPFSMNGRVDLNL
jgi:hypothetical protein